MKKKYLLIAFALIVFVGLIFLSQQSKPESGKTVTFTCENQKNIEATFYPQNDTHVDLKLSDGRRLSVPHAMSGSGARYANEDESFVFWNKGDTAFIDEQGTTTFNNCAILATYTNSDYGFTVSYPQNLIPEKEFQSYYHLPNTWRAEAGPDSTGTALLAIPVYRIDQGGVATGKIYPLYFDAEVRIGVSNNPEDVKNCSAPDAGYSNQTVTEVTLNGINFKKFDFESAGMMQYLQGESYRTVRNGLCFAIERLKTGSSYRDPSMLPGPPDDVLNGYYDATEPIVRTFVFNK